ncbi:hypothetical protein M501DRAFT_941909 [Patellaria atrata CBS 101060]|uniref:Glycoprotease family protein n=1 Tax=Patellaria atrata CBS 101060 TaxID=1346257 RepID=A0A9P4S4B6_9PEZI|nr:hypothetical protein M501DRAFT_941909 [Patellaria atrata CBS 101060]
MLPRAYSHYSGTHAQYDFGFAGNGGNVRSGTTTPTLPSRPHPKPRFNFKFPCWGQRRRNSRDQRKNKKKRRWLCCILLALIVIIILIIVLILTLGRGGAKDDPPTQSAPEASPRPTSDGPTQGSQWLTISGFPPIPTGVSTIARPDPITQKTGCVKPSTMWSCALPKEEHDSISPNDPNQPNFKVEILFQNATARDLGTGSFAPSPPAPNLEDLAFIGNTTDQNVEPFEGEETPFFITLLSPRKETPSRVVRRQEDEEPTSTSNDFNIVTLIPPPSVVVGGVAAPAELLPLPESQPLRLYNRGEPEEHYGFYTYFDRSIFMKNINIRNDTENDFAAIPADQDGGSTIEGAQVRCTWAQTRFLVQIWTNSGDTMPLLGAPSDSSSTPKPTSTFVPSSADAPTANDFDQPGSFPYPVTITLDRHGGDLRSKMLYCYGMDNRSKIIRDLRKFYIETRDFGGELVNPAGGPFSFGDEIPVAIEDGGPGGIDGGNGGCSCQWANWRKSL